MTENTVPSLEQEIINSINEKKNVLSPVAIEAKKEFDQEELIRAQEDKEWFNENRKSIKELSRRVDFLNNIIQKFDLSPFNQSSKKAFWVNFTFGFYRGLGLALGFASAFILYFWIIQKLSFFQNLAVELTKFFGIINFH